MTMTTLHRRLLGAVIFAATLGLLSDAASGQSFQNGAFRFRVRVDAQAIEASDKDPQKVRRDLSGILLMSLLQDNTATAKYSLDFYARDGNGFWDRIANKNITFAKAKHALFASDESLSFPLEDGGLLSAYTTSRLAVRLNKDGSLRAARFVVLGGEADECVLEDGRLAIGSMRFRARSIKFSQLPSDFSA